jgi:sugar lactone lactonase YvrE
MSALEPLGTALQRPECVVATRSGHLFVPDWPGGICGIGPDGDQRRWHAREASIDLRPNGFALEPDGSFLIANLGDDGGIWRLRRDETLQPVILEVDGVRLPPANFVTVDCQQRMWISVSTRHTPRHRAWRTDVHDGFVVLVDERGPRIVADGLHYTNEVRTDPSSQWLYAIETFGRRLCRFPITAGGGIGRSETVVTMTAGCFPDGFAFDEVGGIWITSLISNRLLRWHDDELTTILADENPEFVREAEAAFAEGRLAAQHLGPIPGTRLQQLTSIAFGDSDRRTAYLGSLHSPCLYRFRTPVAGAALTSWSFEPPD